MKAFFIFLMALGVMLVYMDFTGYLNGITPDRYKFSWGMWGLVFFATGAVGMGCAAFS